MWLMALRQSNDWAVIDHPDVGAMFVLEDAGFRLELYMDGPEWCSRWALDGHGGWAGSRKAKLADVVRWAPGLRDEAIGMTRAALIAERAQLAACLRDGLTALAAEDDEKVACILDDLRTWGTRDLIEELEAAGA